MGHVTIDNETIAFPISRATMVSALYGKFRRNPVGAVSRTNGSGSGRATATIDWTVVNYYSDPIS